MHPTLIDTVILGQHLLVKAYGFFMGLAAIAVLAVSVYYISKMKLDRQGSILCLLLMVLTVPVGARILNVAINPTFYARHPERIWAFQAVGFSLMGGLLLAAAAALVASRLFKIPLWPLADALAPGLGIGLALMRTGCYLNGCCFGIRSQLPWAVSFPYGSPAYKYYWAENQAAGGFFNLSQLYASPSLHPTQLYEMLAALMAAGLAIYLIKKQAQAGLAFLAAALLFTLARLGNYFLRVQPSTNEIPFLFYPLIYLIIIIILLTTILHKLRKQTGKHLIPRKS